MTASDRLARAIAATDLAAGDSRAARLARHLAGRPRPATAFADLDAAPRWLRDVEIGRTLARRAALAAAAPALARSIDGRRLGALAAAAGTETLDWAMALGDEGGDTTSLPTADDLESSGLALLATTLPPALAARLPVAPAAATTATARAVAAALACPLGPAA